MGKTFFLLLAVVLALPARAAGTVAVDVGHTLAQPGARSARGRDEFAFNRELAAQVARALAEDGMTVRPINPDGRIDSLGARADAAVGSDLLLSVHHDSVEPRYLKFWAWGGQELSYTDAKRGFGLFVSRRNPDLSASLACASAIGAGLRRAGFLPTLWHGRRHQPADAANGVWYFDNLVVLHRAATPAVLFEAGVIKNRREELQLADPERQSRMAAAVAMGIAGCLVVREKSARE